VITHTPQLLAAALQHHQAGQLADAEQIYRQILAQEPNHPDALHLLGVIALQCGQHDTARQLIQRAIALQPGNAQYHNNLGNVLLAARDFAGAEAVFRRVLQLNPRYPEAQHNFGVALQNQNRVEEAVAAYRLALQMKPDYADAWNHLGEALARQGQLEQATSALQSALRLQPHAAELHYKLGNTFLDQARFPEAVSAYTNALRHQPDFPEAHYNLGLALHHQQQVAAAEASYRAALALRPGYLAAQSNLGKALLDQRQLQPAIDAFHAALAIDPRHPETHFNLGNALVRQGLHSEAARSYSAALQSRPHFPEAQLNLGNVLNEMDQTDAAIAAYLEILAAHPGFADVFVNLAGAYKNLGRFAQSLDAYEQAIALQPANAGYLSNLLYLLHFHPGFNAPAIREEHRRWNDRFAVPLRSSIQPHRNVPDPSRRLKIGYVSSELHDHVIGRNLLPLFTHHDHPQFEIICYAAAQRPDGLTARLQSCADQWRDTIGLSDEALAQQIRADEVDILVDLSLHMAHNRLPVFARQPAPVQLTFAGYPASTGVETIQYRLTDPFLDPPGNDSFYSEESIRLPDSFWCFDPIEEGPAPNPLPAATAGYITFGCLNNFCKVNDSVLDLWSRVLGQVPTSLLLLLAPRGQCREQILHFFSARNIDPARVEFLTKSPRREYLPWHHRIDLILDTFPYNGHTTSLDALWMGVPVVSLAGQHAVSRAGFSQMSNLGLTDLVAFTGDDYVRIATTLAGDLPRLAELRATLRSRLQASPLMDAPRFARHIEQAYRTLWERWCQRP